MILLVPCSSDVLSVSVYTKFRLQLPTFSTTETITVAAGNISTNIVKLSPCTAKLAKRLTCSYDCACFSVHIGLHMLSLSSDSEVLIIYSLTSVLSYSVTH